MSWSVGKGVIGRAVEEALTLAEGQALPVAAQSRPTDQVRRNGCALGMIVGLLALVAAIVILALLIGTAAQGGERGLIGIFATLVFAGLAISGLRSGWRARRTDYVDPRLIVEAGADGVTIAGPGGRHRLAYREIEPEILSLAFRHSVRFLGVKLTTPLGPVQLDDALFVNGRAVAAAIVRGRHGARVARSG